LSNKRAIKVTRGVHANAPAEDFNRSIVRDEVRLALEGMGLSSALATLTKHDEDRAALLGGIGVVMWDMRNSVRLACSSNESVKRTLEELLTNLDESFSTMDELLDKDQYRHIMESTDARVIGNTDDDEDDDPYGILELYGTDAATDLILDEELPDTSNRRRRPR
jgi:hypothetical protein